MTPDPEQVPSSARRPGRPLRAALALAVAAFALRPAAVSAWMPETHRQLAAAAVELLPPEARAALRPRLADLADGSIYPDIIIDGGEHHLWCLDGSCGDAPDWIAAEHARLLADFRTGGGAGALAALVAALFPAGCAAAADPLGLDPERDANLAFRLGALGHYLADLAVPYHTVPYAGSLKERHLAFEREVDLLLPGLAAPFDGRRDDVSANPRGWAIGLAEAARRELPVVDAARIDHRSAPYRDAVARSYARAANALADLWASVLGRLPALPPRAGGPARGSVGEWGP